MVGRFSYSIMLLLTDGAIHDMPQTIDLICQLADLPCSIIIVGIGNANFDAMEDLDGDGGRLYNSANIPASRDIVQFVQLNKALARGDLAEQVLKEVPAQFCAHMKQIGYNPIPQEQVMLDMPSQWR